MKTLTSVCLIALLLALFGVVRFTSGVMEAATSQNPQVRATGRGPGIDALAPDDHHGFTAIFDGKTLGGWDGDPTFWRVENGEIVGETTAEKPLKVNTFLIWRGGKPADFELKVDYRINATNSGIQYRSVELPEVGKWVLKGYQADIDFQNTYTGQLYEERGRAFLALRGQVTRLEAGRKQIIGNLRSGDELKQAIKATDWNSLHVIARGNVLTHILNGELMSQAVDDDQANRALSGLLGFQLHAGPPMKVEFRNVWLKSL